MKSALTFWDSGKLRRSDIFVVAHANKSSSPVGAACSGFFPDDAAPGRSLDSLWAGGSTEMSALTGLGQPHYRLGQANSAYVRLSQVEKIKNFMAPCICLGQPLRQPFKASQGHSRLLKAIQSYSRVSGKKIVYCLHAIPDGGSSRVKPQSRGVKPGQAQSSSLAGKKRLFIFMNHPSNLYQLRPIPTYWDLFRTSYPPPIRQDNSAYSASNSVLSVSLWLNRAKYKPYRLKAGQTGG